jgi:LmbE family N-acetylglucosaminyl deacetylase
MEISEALKIIHALADGVNPLTGEVFSDNSPYQHPQIIRALFVAIRALEQAEKKQASKRELPGNAGKPWDAEEDVQLSEGFDAGMTISQLAHKHQRTSGAIESRLVKSGKLPPDPLNRRWA